MTAAANATIDQARQHIAAHQWPDAVRLLAPHAQNDVNAWILHNLARNMQAAAEHRSDLHQTLLQTPSRDRYRLVKSATGHFTIAHVNDNRQLTSLSPGNDPQHGVSAMMQAFGKAYPDGLPLGLCGLGDGYLLSVLADKPPKLFMDQQQMVHVIEPDPLLVHACFLLHDYSQPTGPLAHPRFHWHVGSDWLTHLTTLTFDDLQTPPPFAIVRQGMNNETTQTHLQAFARSYEAMAARLKRQVEARDADRDPAEQVALFSKHPPRTPRVLVLTCRFTSVLQFAARDAAAAFEKLGWQVRFVIERTGYHRVTHAFLHREQLDFDPDLVLMIDHDRQSQAGIAPPRLPMLNWIQDHMPHLTRAAVGRAMTPLDFAMSFASPLFVDQYAYPPQQMIDMPMMVTRWPDQLPDPAAAPRQPDLLYVSNVSQQPRALADELVSVQPQPLQPLTRAICDQLLAVYEAGGALATRHDLFKLVDRVCADHSTKLAAELRDQLVHQLWNPLNSALYRQQALTWVADTADAMGLDLCIAGSGWDQHPRFKAYACGPVKHGPDLAALTAAAKINLQLEPYPCCAHHRMLDGLAAGGFFLVREHPNNTLLQALSNFLHQTFDDSVQDLPTARRMVSDDRRSTLEDLVTRGAGISYADPPDPVKQVRAWQRAELLIDQPQLLPHLDAITFRDAATCRELIERFLADRGSAARIARDQRANIAGRLTFERSFERVLACMHDRLAAVHRQSTAEVA